MPGTTVDVLVVLSARVPSDVWELTYSALDVATENLTGNALAVAASKAIRFAGGEQFKLSAAVKLDATTLVPIAGGLTVKAEAGQARRPGIRYGERARPT